MSETTTAPQGFLAHAAAAPERDALTDGTVRYTYGQMVGRARRLARLLASKGATPLGRIAVLLPNSAEVIVAGFAGAIGRLSWVPVNWHLKADEVAFILKDSGAQVLLADERLRPYAGPAAAKAGVPVVWAGTKQYEAALEAQDDAPLAEEWTTPQWVFYTSGTTGRPKGVVHGRMDPEVMRMSQMGLVALWGFTADDVHCLAGPAYHAGPGGYAATTFFAGGRLVVMPEWDARAFLSAVHNEKVTTTFLTPAHMIRILEIPEAERASYDLSSLRLIIHGGAPCPIDVKRRLLAALPACNVAELYGASEGGATRIMREEWEKKPGSVGTPWPGVVIRILDQETGEPVPTGEDGVIYIAPPGGSSFEYHGDQEKTSSAWKEGAFTVGDIGHLDDEGFLYLTDRVSDMVLWGGVNIYPREVEDVLHTHPAVVDCAVFGVPDARNGEALAAVVEAREEVAPDALKAWIRARLADFKVPQTIDLVDALPRDPNGKVRKKVLRDEWVAARS
ncbi:MAG TPA: AMP-binding protein [Mycobacteriales bacterium]|nr:AMP-binding protein [Mycobacteriales bacterium]